MTNIVLLIITFVLLSTVLYLYKQLRISRSKVRGSIVVLDGETIVSDVYLEGVTLDVTQAGTVKLQRVHAHGCNPVLCTTWTPPTIHPTGSPLE